MPYFKCGTINHGIFSYHGVVGGRYILFNTFNKYNS